MLITLDGPAGSGKSTVAKLLSRRLHFVHLNSGSLFRALTALCCRLGHLEPWNEEAISNVAATSLICCKKRGEQTLWILDNLDLTDELTNPCVVAHISQVSALPAIRHRARQWQLKWAKGKSAVVEGRDLGSSVFKNAPVKIYLTASLPVRAQRRFDQLRKKKHLKEGATQADIEKELHSRDLADEQRALDPLICPQGAIYLDTSAMSARAAAAHLYRLISVQFGRL